MNPGSGGPCWRHSSSPCLNGLIVSVVELLLRLSKGNFLQTCAALILQKRPGGHSTLHLHHASPRVTHVWFLLWFAFIFSQLRVACVLFDLIGLKLFIMESQSTDLMHGSVYVYVCLLEVRSVEVLCVTSFQLFISFFRTWSWYVLVMADGVQMRLPHPDQSEIDVTKYQNQSGYSCSIMSDLQRVFVCMDMRNKLQDPSTKIDTNYAATVTAAKSFSSKISSMMSSQSEWRHCHTCLVHGAWVG